jgi:hypothetical protein
MSRAFAWLGALTAPVPCDAESIDPQVSDKVESNLNIGKIFIKKR